MALPKHMKTEHGGAKNSSAKRGWGPRSEAKRFAGKARRRIDKLLAGGEEGRRLR
jgi:hypothetical protein